MIDNEWILKYVENNSKFIDYNSDIFNILEGDLLTQLFAVIDEQLSAKSAKTMKSRAIPINVLKKIISKLSKLYVKPPMRTTENPQNQDMIDWYTNEIGINSTMNDCNEAFNAYKNTSIEIIENVNEKQLDVMTIPSHQFLVWSDNIYNRLTPTGYIKFMGTINKGGHPVNKYWVYTRDSFKAIDSDKDVVAEDMKDNKGINPFGIIPFSYLTRSKYLIIPVRDTDTLRMSTLVPLLLSEISFASMFLANPIMYGIDIDAENLSLSPNQFWNFKSVSEESKPNIGVINPNLDTSKQVAFAKEILGVWLETRDIKAGAIGAVNNDNAASGIALAIREMDTTQDRQNQEKYFKKFEQDFWRRLGIIHNTLARVGRIENRKLFVDPEKIEVNIEYSEQKPIVDRQTEINNVIAMYRAGLISKTRSLMTLFPDTSQDEIDIMLQEIEKESTIVNPVATVQSQNT